jgi:hypothetical protein
VAENGLPWRDMAFPGTEQGSRTTCASVGNIQHGQVALYDAAAELRVDQLGNSPKEALPGVVVEVYVAGVGAQEAE